MRLLLLCSLFPKVSPLALIGSDFLPKSPAFYTKGSSTSPLHHNIINMADSDFVNATENGEIPTFGKSDKAKATDFANYFCSYAQLYHQKQMLADHNRMAAYHAAIMGNADVFKDKVVMDVGTGSGILAAWAAQAGARRVYASK
jgi:hypothetical protein